MVLASLFPQTVYFRTNLLYERMNEQSMSKEQQKCKRVFPAGGDWDTFQWSSAPVIRTERAAENKSPGLLMIMFLPKY